MSIIRLQKLVPFFPILLRYGLVAHMRSAIRDMLRPLLLIKQFCVSPRFAILRCEECIAFEENCNGCICLECIVDNATFFPKHVGHVHELAELKRFWIDTSGHDEVVHGVDHKLVLHIAWECIRLGISKMEALLEHCDS
jgi:hypothetical protein